ncbi:MAG TPA: ABC transporter permease [Puia sp.]|uniref:ABC transporter permease n=1 Tax=Puia sp. TaxID=2045100 RepID=UPI002B8EEFF6|nr:ABC transporter permease [Puia sp.]HVU99432.1 ABC transporter permease [Puia sp.]
MAISGLEYGIVLGAYVRMILNFIKITFRNLWKNRSYSFLNIFGLAIGIACAGLIFLWVEDELSFDQSLSKKDRLYYLPTNQTYEGKVRTFSATPGPLGPALAREIPGIEKTCRVRNWQSLFTVGDKAIYENGGWADSTVFELFDLSFVEGNARTAFADPANIVITDKVARQFFGRGKALGKLIKLDNEKEYRVSGIVQDMPVNTTWRFDWIASYQRSYNDHKAEGWMDNWGTNFANTFVLLSPGADVGRIGKELYSFIQSKQKGAGARPWLYSARDWHLRDHFEDGKITGGRIEYVRMFVVIAWIILLIACINFMNLATARSDKRAKEVGVRKVMGAERRGLIGQFIGEAIVMALLSVIIGVILISLVMPAFALLIGKPLELGLMKPLHIGVLAAIALVCGLVAGSYPALYLSAFSPAFVLKGIRTRGGGAAIIRKGLVVAQFTIAVALIISTIVIYQQIEHIRNRDIGYNQNHLIVCGAKGEIHQHFNKIRQDLLNTGVIENAGLNSFNTLWIGNNGSGAKWEGKDASADLLISYRTVTPGFLATAGMRLAEGRDFRSDKPEADSMHILITESFAKAMGKGSAIGKRIWFDNNPPFLVVGVVKDFVFGDMYGKAEPVMFFCSYNDNPDARFLYVRIKQDVPAEVAVARMQVVLKKDNPAYPVDYSFVSDDFNSIFKSETLMGQLSKVFAALAILISCLGLFGLSAYMAERRVKEIGIRKVLGASVTGLTGLLSKEFLQLVGLSALIAFPLAWFSMDHWLRQFAYRIGIEWWIFVAAGLSALIIALLTISFQSVRAAMMNPARSLRSE